MAWSSSRRGTAPKYRTTEHRTLRAHYARILEAGGSLACTAEVCVFNRDPIVNPNGRDPRGLHLGHADNGIDYAGPQHNACNVKDGARRGRAKQSVSPRRWVL
jgi:hypothetical protein